MKKLFKKLSVLLCVVLLVEMVSLQKFCYAEELLNTGEVEAIIEQDSQDIIADVEASEDAIYSELKLQMYNVNREESSNTIFSNFKLINTGTKPIKLSDVKIRYYYMLGGEVAQNFWCDWSSAGTSNVKGTIVRSDPLYQGADTYLEIEFEEESGSLEAGANVELKTRFARTDWLSYKQSDDYTFNSSSSDYEDWTKAVVYVEDNVVWGEEPTTPMNQVSSAGVMMYNNGRDNSTTTINPWFKLYNTGSLPFNLEDVTIRYYYTSDGEKEQNFWCDWSSAGAENVTGEFVQIPFVTNGVDYYFELGFKDGSGSLIAGDFKEIQTRFAKTDWSNYIQSNDFSFNSSASTYVEWSNVGVYLYGKLVWGEGLLFGVPQNIVTSATENQIYVSWDQVEGARGFQIEIDGEIIDNEMNTSYLHTDLEPGTSHTYRVRATNPIMNGDWSDTLVIYTLPDIPQNISSTGMGNAISITWDPVIGATGYDVEVQGSPVDNGSSISFIQSGLDANLQQIFRVRAKNDSGFGKWSEIIAKSTLSSIPSNLKSTSSENEINLYWDMSAGATEYDVEVDGKYVVSTTTSSFQNVGLSSYTEHYYRVRAKNSEGVSNWSEVFYAATLLSVPPNLEAKVSEEQIIITWEQTENATEYELEIDGVVINNGNKNSYTQKAYKNNTEYSYRVRAKNASDTSQWSDEITRKTFTGIPTNITGTANSTEITITWDPVSGVQSYELSVDGKTINCGTSTYYKHKGLAPNTKHSYKVRAINSAGASGWSETITKTTSLDTPTNLHASATTATSITMEWDKVVGADGYDIMVDGIIIDNGTSTSYTHSILEPGSSHIYIVRAKSGLVAGEWGSETSAWSSAVVTPSSLGVPGNIKVLVSGGSITIEWDEVNGATGYDIEIDGKVQNNGNDTIYKHSGLSSLTEHTYRVRAKNAKIVGAWSNSIRTQTTIGVPVNIRTEVQTTNITLMWELVEGATGYEIQADGEIIENVSGNKYIHTPLEPNTMHSYRVRAVGKSGVSDWSEELTDTTMPEIVINIPIDTMFNFVIVTPSNPSSSYIRVVVNYNDKELEVLDLCGATQNIDLTQGIVDGKKILVEEFGKGKIVFRFLDAEETQVNVIKFISKTNTPSNVTYSIE